MPCELSIREWENVSMGWNISELMGVFDIPWVYPEYLMKAITAHPWLYSSRSLLFLMIIYFEKKI